MRGRVAHILLLLAVGCAASKTYTVKLNEHYGHLKNGIHVILLPDKSSPLVEVDVRVTVGAKEDPPGKAGLAHLVEHMLFLQRQAGATEPTLGTVLRRHSVGFNAMTTWDFTHYQTTARAEELGQIIALEGLRFGTGCETITKADFEREREVVRNEIRLRTGSAETQLFLRLHELLYPEGHPYRRSVGGSDAELAALKLEDVCKFIQDHYVPSRATVVVAGAFEPDPTQALLAQAFGGIPDRPGAPLTPVPPVKLGKQRHTVEIDGDESSVVVAWPMPPEYGPDGFAAPYIASVIGGEAAIFTKMYERADAVDYQVLGGPQAPILAIRMTLGKGNSAGDAADTVLGLSNHAHWGLQHLEYENDRAVILGELAATLETLPGRTFSYASFAQFEPETSFETQVKRLVKLDGDQVKRVVREALGEDKASVVILKARSQTASARRAPPVMIAAADLPRDELPVDGRDAAIPIALPSQPLGIGRARRFELANGLKVVLMKTEAPLPVTTVSLTVNAGAGHDPPKRSGLARIAGAVVARRLFSERLGYMPAVTPDATILTARAVSLYDTELIDVLENLSHTTYVSQSSLDEMRKSMKRAIKRQTAKNRSAMSRALGAAVYGEGHPYAAAFDPTVVARLKADDDEVEAFIQRHYRARNATLVVTGVFDEAKVEDHIRRKLLDWSSGKAADPVTAAPQRPDGPVAIGVAGADNEAMIDVRIAFAAPAGMEGSYAARLVLVEMLTRRVLAVRTRLGASYGMFAMYQPTVGPSMIGVGGAVDATRAVEALTTVRAAIDSLRRGEDFLEDFVRARAAIAAQLLGETNDSWTLAWRLGTQAAFGLPAGFNDKLIAQVAAMAPHEVLALARKELAASGETIVCEGARAALEEMFKGAKIENVKIVKAE